MTSDERHAWHVAINQYVWPTKWMYEAKEMAAEVPRLTLLFAMERKGELPTVHRQCSRCEPEPLPENYLTCCLGVKCLECPELTALNAMAATSEAIDEAKAWTCATHIAFKGGDWSRKGYILRVDDRMFWDRVYESMAGSDPGPEPTPEDQP